MCGIIGILGTAAVSERLVDALRRLEYRGYDSAGIAVITENGDPPLTRRRAVGKLKELEAVLAREPIDGFSGIGHTRWATHGTPSEIHAHPHMTSRLALVHNGIIENFQELREELAAYDIQPTGQTDTEIITLLFDHILQSEPDIFSAFKTFLSRLEGAFALGILVRGETNILLAARRGSPLVLGYGKQGSGEFYLGSDAIALATLTNKVAYLKEGDFAILTSAGINIYDETGAAATRAVQITQATGALVDKGNHRHFMQKEIFEQPTVLAQTLGQHLDPHANTVRMPDLPFDLADISRVTLIACGTAYYAGCVARYWFEQIAGIPCEADIASEFRYRDPVMDEKGLVVFVSQSGETADTLAALKLARDKGQKTLAVVNVAESSMEREADAIMRTHAGPEIGVASTKAFTCQLGTLAALVLATAKAKNTISDAKMAEYVKELNHLPAMMAGILHHHEQLASLAEIVAGARDVLFVGRGIHFPIAMEGALKLKEISYIHAEGYAAGELKHGPIALVDEHVPVIGLAPSHELYEKTISNLQEIEARKGRVILISDKQNGHADAYFMPMPKACPLTSPILYAIPVQLLSYYAAVAKGTDVDQPRNLAKSVTVE